MTKPAREINLDTYNITLPGYLPEQFYVNKKKDIQSPQTPTSIGKQQNISFKANYPKTWPVETIEQA
jgi:hypothetical protein